MLLNVPSLPFRLQEQHDCHLLPKQLKCTKKKSKKNGLMCTKKWNIQQVKQFSENKWQSGHTPSLGAWLPHKPGCHLRHGVRKQTFVLGKGSTTSTCSLQASPIIVHILNPDTCTKFNGFIQVIPSLPC